MHSNYKTTLQGKQHESTGIYLLVQRSNQSGRDNAIRPDRASINNTGTQPLLTGEAMLLNQVQSLGGHC